MELNESSSYGPDKIHPSIRKNSADALAIPVTAFFNVLCHKLSPDQWLTTHVTPIYKHLGSC